MTGFDELAAQLAAIRALVLAMAPKCTQCGAPATVQRGVNDLRCDKHGEQTPSTPWPLVGLPHASALRRVLGQ